MTAVEQLLARDFATLVRRFDRDAFADMLIARMKRADRMRIVLIGAAGVLGAGAAASQFSGAVALIDKAMPASAGLEALSLIDPSAMIAASLLAAIAVATIALIPASR